MKTAKILFDIHIFLCVNLLFDFRKSQSTICLFFDRFHDFDSKQTNNNNFKDKIKIRNKKYTLRFIWSFEDKKKQIKKLN